MKQSLVNAVFAQPILLLFTIICALIAVFYAYSPSINWAGDIVEYYGMTQSLLSHTGLSLTTEDEMVLHQQFPPQSLNDPQYYVTGRGNKRYPVHFFAYSVLAIPARIMLQITGADPLNALRVTNVFIFWSMGVFIMLKFLNATRSRLVFLLLLLFSPLITFLYWPGPDIFYLSLLIVGLFYFFNKEFFTAAFLTVIASWHSQPLAIMGAFIGLYYAYNEGLFIIKEGSFSFSLKKNVVLRLGLLAGLVLFPYILNFYFFGVFSPWVKFDEGWTVLNGFGIHNASLKKLSEQFFDLDNGLFWYAPLTLIFGLIWLFKQGKNLSVLLISGLFVLTMFFYQTNPAWHYGTAGYGPSRHAIFLLPIFIYGAFKFLSRQQVRLLVCVGALAIIQGTVLLFNGGFTPDLIKTLYHTPLSIFMLDHAPQLYNPTPEIFVDRTLHSDLHHLSTAIYKKGDECKKAFVLITEGPILKKECGFIPSQYQSSIVNTFAFPSAESRPALAYEATFWPDATSCAKKKIASCLESYSDFLAATKISKPDRIVPVEGVIGAWKLVWGTPLQFVLPPGYHMDYFPSVGVYVNY